MTDYTFVDPDGEVYHQRFNPCITVHDAQLFLPLLCSIPHRIRAMYFRNRKLEEQVTLSSLQISPGPAISIEFFHLSCPPSPEMPPAPDLSFDPSHYISTHRITLCECRSGTLSIARVSVNTATPIQNLPFFSPNGRLYKSGVVLNEAYRLAELGIKPGAIIRVVPMPPPDPERRIVFFHTRGIPNSFCPPNLIDKNFCITVPANCPILTLKKYCGALFGIEPRWIMLGFLDRLMQDRFSLDHYRYVSSGVIDCAIGPMNSDQLRVNFEHYGNLLSSITCPAAMPGVAMMKHLMENQLAVSHPVIVAQPANVVIPPLAMIDEFARHNSLLIGVYARQDRILIVDVNKGPLHVVEIDDETTVYDVKKKLRECVEVPIARQVLRSRDIESELPDDLAFSQFPVRPQFLSLTVRPETGHVVRVRAGQSVIVVPIQGPNDSASDVKWAVAREIGESVKDFGLVLPAARILESDGTLWQAGIGKKTTLFVVPEGEETVPVVIAGGEFSTEFDLPLLATVTVMRDLMTLLRLLPFWPRRIFVDGELITNDEALVKDLGITPGSRIFVA
jgi:hypothetical protein